jgi:hypothetical protein
MPKDDDAIGLDDGEPIGQTATLKLSISDGSHLNLDASPGRHEGRESKEIRLDLAERSREGHASVQFPQQSMGQAVGRG